MSGLCPENRAVRNHQLPTRRTRSSPKSTVQSSRNLQRSRHDRNGEEEHVCEVVLGFWRRQGGEERWLNENDGNDMSAMGQVICIKTPEENANVTRHAPRSGSGVAKNSIIRRPSVRREQHLARSRSRNRRALYMFDCSENGCVRVLHKGKSVTSHGRLDGCATNQKKSCSRHCGSSA
jgi:hypothetical protein